MFDFLGVWLTQFNPGTAMSPVNKRLCVELAHLTQELILPAKNLRWAAARMLTLQRTRKSLTLRKVSDPN